MCHFNQNTLTLTLEIAKHKKCVVTFWHSVYVGPGIVDDQYIVIIKTQMPAYDYSTNRYTLLFV